MYGSLYMYRTFITKQPKRKKENIETNVAKPKRNKNDEEETKKKTMDQ